MKKIKIAVLVIAICGIFSAAVCANYFSSSLYVSSSQNYSNGFSSQPSTIYLLSLAKSQHSLEAQALAQDYQDLGGAGYIWQHEKYYHVIYDAYENSVDAEKIKKNLQKQLIESQIINLSIPSFTIDLELSAAKHAAIRNSYESFWQSYRTLADLATGLQAGVYSQTFVQEKLNKLQSTLTKAHDDFHEQFENHFDNTTTAFGEYLADVMESVMLASCTEQSLKYHSVEILNIIFNMSQEFN